MKQWFWRLLPLAALTALGVGGWRVCFPSPEHAIRKRLAELTHLASFGPDEGPLAKVLNPDKLTSLFTPDVAVRLEVYGYAHSFDGRERLRETAMAARSTLTSFKLEFPDINVAVAPDRQSAVVDLTARGRVPGERDPQVYELRLTMQKTGGDWLIRRVETAKTLMESRPREVYACRGAPFERFDHR